MTLRPERPDRDRRGRPQPTQSLGRALALGAPLALALGCLVPAAASAAFAPGATAASALGSQLADRPSSAPMLSGDGRFVVISATSSVLLGQPRTAGEYYSSGFVRKDLVTGAVDLVGTPETRRRSDGAVVARGAVDGVAGISDDGRYVLFGSTVPLTDGVQSTITPEVYVRDMTLPRSDGGSYELVSTPDGSGPARYEDRAAGSKPGADGFALSDDGRTAVFVTQTASNVPAGAAISTPRWQVFVRDLDARTTRLVTRDSSDPSGAGTPIQPTRGAAAPAPMLSGDGSAVAWVGFGAVRQARFLPGETLAPTSDLLWRDLDAGPGTPARRVAGAADPDDPACPSDAVLVPDRSATGPCYGPFAAPEEITLNDPTPPSLAGISDDGRRVLFLSQGIPRPAPDVVRSGTAYQADMSPGVTRKAGVGVAWSQPAARRPIRSGTLAGDGRHGAFVSADSQFDDFRTLGSVQSGELLTSNVFAIDLAARTIERATVAPNGADYQLAILSDSVGEPTVSDDGGTIAFAAGDGNLFVGDVNDADDVMVLRRRVDDGGHGRERDLPAPPPAATIAEPPLTPLPPLHAVVGRVRVDARGVATVRVRVPAAGTLSARASGRVPRGRGAGARSGRALRVGGDRRTPRRATTVVLRIVPSAAARRSLARAPHRIEVRLSVDFDAGARTSSAEQTYALRRVVARARRRPRTARRTGAGGRRRHAPRRGVR